MKTLETKYVYQGIEYEYFAPRNSNNFPEESSKSAYQHIVLYYTFKKTVELLDVPSGNKYLPKLSDNSNITLEILCL